MVRVSLQKYVKHEEEDDSALDIVVSEYSSFVAKCKKISPRIKTEPHVCEALPIRSSSTDTCTTSGSTDDELEQRFQESVSVSFPYGYRTQPGLDLVHIGAIFAEPATIEDAASSHLINQGAECIKPFANGDDIFSSYVPSYQEAARGDKSKAVRGSRVTKPPSSSSQKRKNKYTLSSEVDSGPLASILYCGGCSGNERGFPDFFYAHDPDKFHMYSGNCSCGLRRWDFFKRQLQYHFEAGHFHEEFEGEEAAIAAYWRVMDASPATSKVGLPNYEELQYVCKLEALWGLDRIKTRKCPENHRIYRVHPQDKPYKLPKRDLQALQADVASTAPLTGLDTAPTTSLTDLSIDNSTTQAVSNDFDNSEVTQEEFNALRHQVANLEGCFKTMVHAQASQARVSRSHPFMNEEPFLPLGLSQPSHLDGIYTSWTNSMSSQSSRSGTSLMTPKTLSTGPTSISECGQEDFIDPQLLDNPGFDFLNHSQV